jgi:hypothetical protein
MENAFQAYFSVPPDKCCCDSSNYDKKLTYIPYNSLYTIHPAFVYYILRVSSKPQVIKWIRKNKQIKILLHEKHTESPLQRQFGYVPSGK